MVGGRRRVSPAAAGYACALACGQARSSRRNRHAGEASEAAVSADTESADHVSTAVVGVEVPAVLGEREIRRVRRRRVRGLREDECEGPVLVDREGRDRVASRICGEGVAAVLGNRDPARCRLGGRYGPADGGQSAVLRKLVGRCRGEGRRSRRLGDHEVAAVTEREAERGRAGRGVACRGAGHAVLADYEDVERAGALLGHDERATRRRELDLRRPVAGEGADRARDRAELSVRRTEACDGAARRVHHVDKVVARGNADGLDSAGGDTVAPGEALGGDPEDGDVVAAGVDGVEPAAVFTDRDRALRAEASTAAAGRERTGPGELARGGTVVGDDGIGLGVRERVYGTRAAFSRRGQRGRTEQKRDERYEREDDA